MVCVCLCIYICLFVYMYIYLFLVCFFVKVLVCIYFEGKGVDIFKKVLKLKLKSNRGFK